MEKYKIYIDVVISLIVAVIGYVVLGSTGVLEKEGFKITGGISIYFLNFIMMNRYYRKYVDNSVDNNNEIKILKLTSREEYQKAVVENIRRSKKSVIMLMRSLKSSSESKQIQEEVEEIRKSIKDAISDNSDLSVLVVTGSNEEYLRDSYELRQISNNVEVYFSQLMRTCDMSAVLVDNQTLVIGFSRKTETPEERTSKWIEGHSVTLAGVISEHANKLKSTGKPYNIFLQNSIERILPEYQNDIETVSRLLNLPKMELEKCCSLSTNNSVN